MVPPVARAIVAPWSVPQAGERVPSGAACLEGTRSDTDPVVILTYDFSHRRVVRRKTAKYDFR